MENVVLIIHLLLALALIGVVLLQRSEGGGLGMGSGGGAISARSAATALGKVTWVLAIGFICTSIALTAIAARKSSESSVMDRLTDAPAAAEETAPATPALDENNLLPPAPSDESPLVPKAD
ncbi:preprotein translocase subunit SecG [Aquicoccus sp. G2-2]|jgi:preprotein translocase subunit SecG|uniref:preprotein translocase subunit SecG n=1 Tax=Aquicoccus sp. G2-2 TaxID=3092120 RepID=UPI002ADF23F2|nr:preprotein translocase subunit SecG [Aquicoccus sp. G2-2]MEA1112743.1 preprotein translocase subunit SecG [Aquicoccus sp. G2-2]